MLSSFSIGIFHCKVFALGSCPDRISRNFDTNSHVLKTSTSGQILHRTSSWCFSSLIFSEPLHTFALLFIRPCSSGRTGRARPGFRFIYLFPRSRQRRSEFRPAWGRVDTGKREPPGAARRGRGVGAEAGRGAERGGAGLARGARRAGASKVGCCWLSLRLRRRWPETDAHRLRAAPAVFLPGSAPTRPRRRGRPRGALLENSSVSASGLLGRKPSAPR